MLDEEAKKILKIKLPRMPEVKPRTFKAGRKISRPHGYKVTSQKQLRALRDGAVPAGGVLNPYGHYGDSRRSRYRVTYFGLKLKPGLREAAMKRKRAKLKLKRAIALEAHELQQIARESASLAMKTLKEIAGNKREPAPSRIAASAVILDRAYGKASQTSITANVTNGKESEIDGAELDKRISATLKRVEALTNRTPKTRARPNKPADIRKYH